ncbi:MAG: hypothetical protein FRX48_04098 [Lasallia pustulata]|uniref:Uncharacterized protein n=1 Tax=Lasallia pustulata TaxID=136370 RepID=A0A5M8PSM4_9LECA|nr:MAG: hypothetical protein FRX48_04098 [Lasallia pustulata]
MFWWGEDHKQSARRNTAISHRTLTHLLPIIFTVIATRRRHCCPVVGRAKAIWLAMWYGAGVQKNVRTQKTQLKSPPTGPEKEDMRI